MNFILSIFLDIIYMIYSNNTIIDKLFDNINRKIADFIGDFAQKTCIFCMGGGQSTAHSSTICFYYTTIFFFCQVFYTTFLELFLFFSPLPEGTLCRPKVPFHPPRALARLRRSNSCFKQKGNPLTFLSPNYSTYPRYSLLSSFSLSQVCSS